MLIVFRLTTSCFTGHLALGWTLALALEILFTDMGGEDKESAAEGSGWVSVLVGIKSLFDGNNVGATVGIGFDGSRRSRISRPSFDRRTVTDKHI